jgi:hypothetical protein
MSRPRFESTRIQIYNVNAVLTCSVAVIGHSFDLHNYQHVTLLLLLLLLLVVVVVVVVVVFRQFAVIRNFIDFFYIFYELRNVQKLVQGSVRNKLPDPVFLVVFFRRMTIVTLYRPH